MIIKNKEKFKEFLNENVKVLYYDYEKYEDDLIKQYYESEYKENEIYEYELPRFESKDKTPHIIEFQVESKFDEDGNIVNETIIF